jgi:preprotein translocase subunit SecY
MATDNTDSGFFSKTNDLRNRILFTILILCVYRLGTYVPLPGINPESLKTLMESSSKGLLGMFNIFSGGAVNRMAIFALGIMPYISSSIIIQLLTGVSETFKNLKNQGEIGRKKITQYTRYGTLGLAIVQAIGISVALEAQPGLVIDPGMMFRFTTIVTLVTGTMFLMWLGEQITERGLGNGISLIIFAGIAAGLPGSIGGLFELVRTGSMVPLMALFIVAMVIAVTTMNKAIKGTMEPVLTNSNNPPIDPGKPAAIPANIIKEIPFPRPLSVICSPSHIRNIVPVTKVTIVVNLNIIPGSITKPG